MLIREDIILRILQHHSVLQAFQLQFSSRLVSEDEFSKLEIPENNAAAVGVVDRGHNLAEQGAGSGFPQPPARTHVGMEIAVAGR